MRRSLVVALVVSVCMIGFSLGGLTAAWGHEHNRVSGWECVRK